jgi:hypothetical protein
LYGCFAARFSFQGDFPLAPEDRNIYEATPKLRRYVIFIGMPPLLYGAYLLLRHR